MGMTMKLTLDDNYFEIQDDLLVRCRGTAVIGNMPDRVTRIGKGAFRDCMAEELDLKKAAKAASEKSIQMIRQSGSRRKNYRG